MSKVYIQYNSLLHYRNAIFKALSESSKHDFSILADTQPDQDFMKVSDTFGIAFIHTKTKRIKLPFLPDLYWQPDTLNIISKEDPDVVIILSIPYSITAWVVAFWCLLKKKPTLFWGHGVLGNESGMKWVFRRLFYTLASGHLLYGDHAKNYMVSKGLNPETMYVVYNSLDYDLQVIARENVSQHDIQGFRDGLGVSSGEALAIFSGRFQKPKKLDLLMDAVYQLKRQNKIIHVALIGKGEEEQALLALVHSYGISSQIHFLGEIYNEDRLAVAYRASDLCVIPSFAGLTIMHSLVYGTPVLINSNVASNPPEIEAVIDGVTGFIFKENDANDMISKLDNALFPYPAKEKMSDACMKIIEERYNPRYQLKVFEQAVDDILTRKTL